MRIAKVIGNIWATRKEERLAGLKLLIVRPLDVCSGSCDRAPVVAADLIGAGVGETVQVLNTIEPFDAINPTIENVTDHFNDELQGMLWENGGELVSLEGSETPTRSYIVSHRNEEEFMERIGKIQSQQISGIVNYVVDQIVEENGGQW